MFGLMAVAGQCLGDGRMGWNGRHDLVSKLRKSRVEAEWLAGDDR